MSEQTISKEKQIEEMARTLCGEKEKNCAECESCYRCEFWIESSTLHEAGYRKQSEGEWVDKPTGAYCRMQSWCSACGKHSGIGGIESNRHKPFCPNCGARMKGGAGK